MKDLLMSLFVVTTANAIWMLVVSGIVLGVSFFVQSLISVPEGYSPLAIPCTLSGLAVFIISGFDFTKPFTPNKFQ